MTNYEKIRAAARLIREHALRIGSADAHDLVLLARIAERDNDHCVCVSFRRGKSGEAPTVELAVRFEIFPGYGSDGSDETLKVEVNWSAVGAVSLEAAASFADLIAKVVDLAGVVDREVLKKS